MSWLSKIFHRIFDRPETRLAVDVDKVLAEKAAKKGEPLDYQHSIVDLMKVLDLDSSIGARMELCEELGYAGKRDGSDEMNIWLHKRVMQLVKDGEFTD